MGNCVSEKKSGRKHLYNREAKDIDQDPKPNKSTNDEEKVNPQEKAMDDDEEFEVDYSSIMIRGSKVQKKKKLLQDKSKDIREQKESEVQKDRSRNHQSHQQQEKNTSPKKRQSYFSSELIALESQVIVEQVGESKIEDYNSKISFDFMISKGQAGPLSVPTITYEQIGRIL